MKKISKTFIFILFCGVCIWGNLFHVRADDSTQRKESKVIKVGYMDYKGFIERQSDGTYQGYAVSYLNEIAKYTGWTYEYKFDNWENLLEKLANGEIDLLCSAQYTDERAQVYEYSDTAIGSERGVLYTSLDNEDIYYNDYEKINGMKIGVLANSYHAAVLPQYAQEHGFSYEEKVYASESDLKNGLKTGEVDLIASGSLALHRNLKTVILFGSAPFYIITGKGERDLMTPINHALLEIHDVNPYLEPELYNTFYSTSATTTLPLYTREEAEYIRNSDTISVGCWSDSYPLSSADSSGETCEGVEVGILNLIEKKSGLDFQIVPISSQKRPAEHLKDGDIDIIAGMNRSEIFLEDAELQVSNEFLNSNAVIVQKKGVAFSSMNNLTVAIPYEYQYLFDYVKTEYENCNILYKDSIEECLISVDSGESDIAIHNSYIISYLLQKPRYANLTIIPSKSVTEKACVIANKNVDPILISILNKTIACLDDKAIQEIIMEYTVANPYERTASDFMYQYRYAIALFCVLVLFVGIAIRHRSSAKIARALQDKETQILRIRAEYDSLTQIYNRDTFYEKIKAVIGKNPIVKYDILCMDVDQFKLVNDFYGKEEGDRLLQFIAENLSCHVSKRGGICGRIGGNSFAAYVPRDEVARNGLYEFAKAELNKYPLDIDISVRFGVFQIEDLSVSVIAMCDRARMAMEKIKGNALIHVGIYSKAQRMELMREQEIINDMYTALEEEQFKVYIQPKCKLETGEVIGGEALVRWEHPKRGVISPGQFIPIFEKNGFITKLDEYMWEHTCMLISKWKCAGVKVLPISVNISRVNFYAGDLKKHLLHLLETYHVTTEELELEVTESTFADDEMQLYQDLHELQEVGFKILMDDFGSGYSSLNMLKQAPIDVIKIDLRFIQGPDPMGRGIDILQGIMSMAEAMKLPVIAEGVETKENVEMLKSLHCEYAQGYYFSRPIPNETFLKMISER